MKTTMNDEGGVLQAFRPQTGLVLGSGLGTFADRLEVVERLSFADAGLPQSRVSGHAGEVILGTMGKARLAVLSGRVHLYEGWSAADVTAGVRLLAGAGIGSLILTNAAGTLNPGFPPGQWMMLMDHLNLTGQSPLTGGPNFVDMSAVYAPRLRETFARAAAAQGMPLHQGVYAGLCGPQYETPAEIRMLRTFGAALVGMSTVHEVIALAHMGIKVAGLSCVTNHAAGVSAQPLDHAEVAQTANEAGPKLLALVQAFAAILAEGQA